MTHRNYRYYICMLLLAAAMAAPVVHAADSDAAVSLGDSIAGVYTYAQTLVGFAVFVMFLYAGIQLILGNRKQAQTIAQDAVIGLVLLFSAYIILNTINHSFVSQQGSTLPKLK